MLTEEQVVGLEGGCSALAKELRDSIRVRNEAAAAAAAREAAEQAEAVAAGKVSTEDGQAVAALDKLAAALTELRNALVPPATS